MDNCAGLGAAMGEAARRDRVDDLERRVGVLEAKPQGKAISKTATVSVRLIADSGYEADEVARISPGQWGRICKILAEENNND